MSKEDRYGKFDYSRLISWDQRLQREWPFLEEILGDIPARRILDLGAGTGEHARFLAAKGFEVVGVDASPAMVAKSRESSAENVSFVEGDMRELPSLLEGKFGAALCLGNALPHLTGERDLARLAEALRGVLLPGAPVVLQFLNYHRIEARRERNLPVSFLADPDDAQASLVFLRLIEMGTGRDVTFMPTILRMRPDREPPVELLASERVEIRGWRRDDAEVAFAGAGFRSIETWGSYQKGRFEPEESRDVILVARAG